MSEPTLRQFFTSDYFRAERPLSCENIEYFHSSVGATFPLSTSVLTWTSESVPAKNVTSEKPASDIEKKTTVVNTFQIASGYLGWLTI